MSVTDIWRPKRPGPASDRDSATRQTLRAGIRAPPPEKLYVTHWCKHWVCAKSAPLFRRLFLMTARGRGFRINSRAPLREGVLRKERVIQQMAWYGMVENTYGVK